MRRAAKQWSPAPWLEDGENEVFEDIRDRKGGRRSLAIGLLPPRLLRPFLHEVLHGDSQSAVALAAGFELKGVPVPEALDWIHAEELVELKRAVAEYQKKP